jgi:8-oxo-dGTP diphosphatase
MTVQLAGCILFDKEGGLALLHRSVDGLEQWELPGGKVEEGEAKEQAAKRELLEELGVKVRIIREIGEAGFNDEGKDYNYTWFEAEVIDGTPSIKEPQKFNDLAYLKTEQLSTLKLSANMQNLYLKLKLGEISLIG